MMRKDAFIYLLFVALATLFWWGRAMSSQREISIKLPIVYTNIPTPVVFDTLLPSYLEITLRDNGRLLRQVQHTKPNVTINMAERLDSSTHTMLLSTDIIRQKIQDILPGSTNIQQIVPEEIHATYHIEATKSVPIRLCAQWTMEEQYQLIAPPLLEPAYVDIYGTPQAIQTITHINTDSISVKQVHDSIQREVALIFPPGVRSPIKTTSVVWKAEQFTDKSFTIPIEVVGLPEGEVMHLFPKTTTVTVRVGISHFTEVSAEDFRAVCEYPYHTQNTLTVNIIPNNPHVSQVRTSTREVEYIIER